MKIAFFIIGAMAAASGIALALFTAFGKLPFLSGYTAGLVVTLGGGAYLTHAKPPRVGAAAPDDNR